MTDTEREPFEAAAWRKGRINTYRNGDGYLSDRTQLLWEFWQTGRAPLLELLREFVNLEGGSDYWTRYQDLRERAQKETE